MLIPPPTTPPTDQTTEERAQAILEMSDEVWRVFRNAFLIASLAFISEIKINVIALNVLQTIFIEFYHRSRATALLLGSQPVSLRSKCVSTQICHERR